MSSINLLPVKYRTVKSTRVVVILLCTLFILTLSYLLHLIYDLNTKIEIIENDIEDTANQVAKLSYLTDLEARISTIKLKTEEIQTAYQRGRLYETQILNIIESVIPPELQMKSLTISRDGNIELIDCVANSYNVVARLLTNIKNSSLIKNIEISSIVKGKSNEGETIKDSFPERGEEYFSIGDIATTDIFNDTYTFSLKFIIAPNN